MRLFLTLLASLLFAASARAQDCNQAAPQAISQIALPDHPFSAIPTADGCTIFVSLRGKTSRIAVLTRAGGAVSTAHIVDAKAALGGMALSHNGQILAAANGPGVTLFDTAKLVAGADDAALGYLNDGAGAGSIYVAFSPDDHFLFVSDENSDTLSIYDFAALLAGKSAKMIGQVHTGLAPVGLALSPDGRLLYSTSEVGDDGAPICSEGGGKSHPVGLLMVIDVARAASDPNNAVLAHVPAGCNPVRVALSADGGTAYVSARGDNALKVFDTAKLLTSAGAALFATMKVGKAPVGVALGNGNVFVTNSDRFGGGTNQSVSVIAVNDLTGAQGDIPAGGFPRELMLTADGKTLLVTNFDSNTLELVDLARLGQFRK